MAKSKKNLKLVTQKSKVAAQNTDLARDLQLLFEIGTMRHLDRVWKQFMGPDTANIAEHLFRVAWIALTIAKHEGEIDHEKLLKIALVHDISESRTGDVHYISRQYTSRNEKMAVEDVFEGTVHADEMNALTDEYEERKSKESQIVKDADNLDVQIELAEMRAQGHSLGKVWIKDRMAHVYPKLYTETARRMWKDIDAAEPHDWHLTSPRNRFQQGDWRKK